MKLSDFINYRPEQKTLSAKDKAMRLLAAFLGLMLLCTLLSRAADSITMPQVTAEKPSRSAISHTVRASGTVQAGTETLVTATQGILVESIQADVGQKVSVGDAVFTLNAGSLAEKLREEKMALQKLRLEFSSQALSSQLADQIEQLSYTRAYEDYSDAFNRSYKVLDDATAARGDALVALRKYYAANKAVIDKWTGSVPPGASNVAESEIVAQYYRLQGEYDAADSVYEAARDSRKDGWKNAQRSLEDAQLALDFDVDKQGEIMGLMLAMEEENQKELQRLADDGGVVRSPIDGVVSKVNVEPGSATGQNAAALVAHLDGGFRFVAELTDDDLKFVEKNSSGTVALASGWPEKVTLESLRDRTATVLLPDGKGELGARGTLELSQKTDSNFLCVPMSALRSDGEQKYVMVLREAETVLGTQLTAERVDVSLEDNNETRAAVNGALLEGDRVIVSGNKPIRAGDRVRLAAQ